jgi:GNAT superfamily N-acetyltransferase
MNSATWPIRRAVVDDAPELARLRYEFRSTQQTMVEDREQFEERCRYWMRERLLPGAAWRCWVGIDKGRLIGTLWLQVVEKIPNPGEEQEYHGYISSVYVIPDHRHSGVGTALLLACLEECDSLDLDAVFLWCTPESRPLYERHGFHGPGPLLCRQ